MNYELLKMQKKTKEKSVLYGNFELYSRVSKLLNCNTNSHHTRDHHTQKLKCKFFGTSAVSPPPVTPQVWPMTF